jgi:hypothetical protein
MGLGRSTTLSNIYNAFADENSGGKGRFECTGRYGRIGRGEIDIRIDRMYGSQRAR